MKYKASWAPGRQDGGLVPLPRPEPMLGVPTIERQGSNGCSSHFDKHNEEMSQGNVGTFRSLGVGLSQERLSRVSKAEA